MKLDNRLKLNLNRCLHTEFPPFNASGIVFMGDNMKQTMEPGAVPNVEANGSNTELERGAAGGQTPSSLEETNCFSEQGKHRCIIVV
jgi:hypothetical protein